MMKVLRSPLFLAFVLLVGQFACARVNAAEEEDKALRLTLRARSHAELSRIDEGLAALRRDRELCRVQLANELLPLRCFKVIRAESAAGLMSSNQSKREFEWLERLCLKRVKAIKSTSFIESVRELHELPKTCREQAELRWGDLRYRKEADNPAELFAERFSDEPDAGGPKLELSDAERTMKGSRRMK